RNGEQESRDKPTTRTGATRNGWPLFHGLRIHHGEPHLAAEIPRNNGASARTDVACQITQGRPVRRCSCRLRYQKRLSSLVTLVATQVNGGPIQIGKLELHVVGFRLRNLLGAITICLVREQVSRRIVNR